MREPRARRVSCDRSVNLALCPLTRLTAGAGMKLLTQDATMTHPYTAQDAVAPFLQPPQAHTARDSQGKRVSRYTRATACVLSLVATGTSAAIAVVAGCDRGGSSTERFAWIFVGLVLLLSARQFPLLHVAYLSRFAW